MENQTIEADNDLDLVVGEFEQDLDDSQAQVASTCVRVYCK